LLSRHHDLIIGYLGDFMRQLAIEERAEPEWMSSEYLQLALNARTVRDMAQVLFIVFGTAPALYVAAGAVGEGPFSPLVLLWYGSVACSLVAVGVVVKTRWDRRRILPSLRPQPNKPLQPTSGARGRG
jgi:hypothetical protein